MMVTLVLTKVFRHKNSRAAGCVLHSKKDEGGYQAMYGIVVHNHIVDNAPLQGKYPAACEKI